MNAQEYLAVALFPEGDVGTRHTTLKTPQEVADFLCREFKFYPGQILLIENGPEDGWAEKPIAPGPTVVHHWIIGEHYEQK